MEKRRLGKTDMEVSVLTFGGIVVDGMEADEAARVVAESVEQGINYFDVAPQYGNAQYVLGPALKPYRKDVYLACKTGRRNAKEAKEELLESLKALQTDYFDNYQFHGLDDPDEIEEVFAPGGAMETLLWAKEQGLARNIGFTCHQDRAAEAIIEKGKGAFGTMLFPVNFAYREQKQGSVSAVELCRKNDIGVIAIKALAHRNWLEGEERTYPKCWYKPIYDDPELARLALNYTLTQAVGTAVPPGDKRMLKVALDIINDQGGKTVPLTREESDRLHQAAMAVNDVIF